MIICHELQRNKMGNPTPAGPAGLASWRQCSGVPAPILVQNDGSRRYGDERRKPTNGKFIRATKSSYGLDDNTRFFPVPTSLDEHAVRLRVVAPVQHFGDDARPPRGLRASGDGVDGLVGAHLVLFVWSSACLPVPPRAAAGGGAVYRCVPERPLRARAAPEKLPGRASAGPGGSPVKRAAPGPEIEGGRLGHGALLSGRRCLSSGSGR